MDGGPPAGGVRIACTPTSNNCGAGNAWVALVCVAPLVHPHVGRGLCRVSNPAAPALLGTHADTGDVWRVRVADGFVQYTVRDTRKLVIASSVFAP